MMDFFEPGNALDSLRSSSFDSLSAYAEVIDNAIQAKAKNINIYFFCEQKSSRLDKIVDLAFGDDGDGMDEATLHSCLKLGWSSRYNDRSGIGRFGVGMVLGAIHECKRVEVYSKKVGGDWLYTYVDLDEVANKTLSSIPSPRHKNIPSKYKNLVSENSGTLVVWSKYDRQKTRKLETIKNDTHEYFGRTFRKFIWQDNLEIRVNEQLVLAHDPLYVTTEKTKFPNDPPATLYEPIIINYPIPEESRVPGGMNESEIQIKFSLLPAEFRQRQGSGNLLETRERLIHQNEGISILRNNREVFYGDLPGWSKLTLQSGGRNAWKIEEIDRWWGCEISFNAELDSCFDVKNIKRGANPEVELKRLIKEKITPTYKTALSNIRKLWDENKKADENERDDGGRSSHFGAEQAAKRIDSKLQSSRKNAEVSIEEATKKIADETLADLENVEREKILALFEAQPFTISNSNWRGSVHWELEHYGGKTLLQYNLSHIFFKKYYEIVDALIEDDAAARKLKDLIDLMHISIAKSQSMFSEDSMSISNFNNQWGMFLENYVRNWSENQED